MLSQQSRVDAKPFQRGVEGCRTRFRKIPLSLFTVFLFLLPFGLRADHARGPFGTFFAVHLEVGHGPLQYPDYQRRFWPDLVKLVERADRYDAKLTILFQTQWAEYVLKDPEKMEKVRKWQEEGHEVGLHYHTVFHKGWNGFTNRTDEKYTQDPRYRGDVDQMIAPVKELAGPYGLVTACVGPDGPERGAKRPGTIDEIDFPEEILYDVDGILPPDALQEPFRFQFKGRERYQLGQALLAKRGPWRKGTDVLGVLKRRYEEAGPNQVFGVATHGNNFSESSDDIESWFEFIREKGTKIETVRQIMDRYLSGDTR